MNRHRKQVLKRSIIVGCLLLLASLVPTNSPGQAGPDWITTKDRTGVCQISVPKNWGQSVVLVKAFGPLEPLDAQTQSMYAQRMLENTPKRVFYVMKFNPPPGTKPSTTYMVSVPGQGFHCTAQLVVQPNYSEDEVKKIVGTFTAKAP